MRSFLTSFLAVSVLIAAVCYKGAQAQSVACVTTSSGDDTLEYNVKIVFLGLMTFVPGPNTATVIIPDVTDGHDEDLGNDNHSAHQHVPYILARKNAMCKELPINSKHRFHNTRFEPDTYHYLVLEGEQISIDDDNQLAVNGPLAYTTNEPSSSTVVCPEKETEGSLYWLSSLARVTTTTHEPDPDHFAKQPPEDLIAARIVLREGSLRTRVIEKSQPWEFRVPHPGGGMNAVTHTQALAEEVEWNFRARGVPFILNLNSFDGTEGRRVAFVPDRSAGNGTLVIIIGNTTRGDTGPISGSGPEARDDHYSVYHQFIKGNTHGDGPIPHLTDDSIPSCTAFVVPATLQTAMTTTTTTQSAAATPEVSHAHAIAVTGQAAPSGLNCSPDKWP